MSPAGRVRLIAAGSLLLTAFGVSVTGWGSASWVALPLLALAVAVTEIAVVHLSAGRQRFTFSLTEGAIGAAYVYAPGAWTVVAVTIGLLVAQVVLVRRLESDPEVQKRITAPEADEPPRRRKGRRD